MYNSKCINIGNYRILDVATLLPLFNIRANASMVLERQLRKMDSTVSGFEKQLSDDDAIPDRPSAIQIRTQEIQVKTHFILNLVGCIPFNI